ncbi:hypothetical protein FRC17_005641 [Serendipita sp. 399]|nr:hypothetical protein FRC17_005641 [Serendipita sp. 399]
MSTHTVAELALAHILDQYSQWKASKEGKSPLFVAVQGPQGIGKTYLTRQLVSDLKNHHIRATVFSIDDLYLGYEGLNAVAAANSGNALLQGRGLPGTHDIDLGTAIFERLSGINHISPSSGQDAEPLRIPVFDKSLHGGFGDRLPVNQWNVVNEMVDLVILEGWCMGFYPISRSELAERWEQKEGLGFPASLQLTNGVEDITTINSNLELYADQWYPFFHCLVQIAPSHGRYDDIYRWRLQQEHTMKEANGGKGMTDDQVRKVGPTGTNQQASPSRTFFATTMALTLAQMLDSYRISPETGFAMDRPSPTTFTNPALQPWLVISRQLPSLIRDGTLRAKIDALPVLSPTDLLDSIEEYRLAFTLLTFMSQAYIWANASIDRPSSILPASLSIPLIEVAQELEVIPAYIYASGSIWLYTRDRVTGNEHCVCSFTGTKDEEHFNLTTHNIERIGGAALIQSLRASRFAGQGDEDGARECLEKTADILKQCRDILKTMRNGCSPDVFFFQIRPYLLGSQSIEGGVRYLTGDEREDVYHFPGASAAQSSLFQALDILLGVFHGYSERAEFVQQMRKSMPGYHVRFLDDIKDLPSISDFIEQCSSESPAREAYNQALMALQEFRSEHIRIVTSYVLQPSKRSMSASERDESQPKQGSGGSSDLMTLLKGMRDDTKDCAKTD